MIDFQQVSKNFGTQSVLVNAGLRINAGERVGIVGPNGAGKSTLFSLIVGEISTDAGSVILPRNCRLGYLRQHLEPDSADVSLLEYAESGVPELVTIERRMHDLEHALADPDADRGRALEELGDLQTRFENMGGYRMRHRAESALSGLGFAEGEFAQPFTTLSGGWQMRAELARVTVAEPELLLMDEPSNYLDTVAIEWLQRFLRDFAGTLVLISHDRYLLGSLCTVTVEVANGEVTRYPGTYDYYVRERAQRQEQRISAVKKQDRVRKQAEKFIERFRAKNTKSSLVQSKIKMLERMDEIVVTRAAMSPGRIRIPSPPRCGQHVAQLSDAGATYDSKRWVLRHVELAVERGDKTALVGLNGTGKTTLLRLLAGRLPPSEGVRRLGHNVTVGYQSQDFADTLQERATVFSSVKEVGGGASDQQVRTLLGGFGFSGDSIEKTVGVLSGGEKVRLAFARLLVNPPSFLILDEPTTHLDIPAREALEKGLRSYTGTLCFVSHDIEFIRRVATSIVAMAPPGIMHYPGGYDYYREKIAADQGAAPAPVSQAAPPQRQTERRVRAEVIQKYSRARRELKKQVERLEARVEQLESEQKTLADRLSSSEPGLDHIDINRRLAELQQEIPDTTRRWEAFAMEWDDLEREYAEKRALRQP